MSAKNQSLAKRKDAKKAKRARAIKAQAHKETQALHTKKRETAKMRDTRLRYDIATQGVIATAAKLKEEGYKGKTAKKLTNVEILKNVQEMIPVFATLHGAVEVADVLVRERRFDYTPAGLDIVTAFDKNIVSITEDINAMYDFMDAGKKPEDFMQVFVHYIDTLAEVLTMQLHQLLEEVLRPHQPIIDQYIKEHAGSVHTMESFSMEMHNQRMERIAPLYRTAALAAEDMTKPLGGELVEDDDILGELAADSAKEIPTDPLTC